VKVKYADFRQITRSRTVTMPLRSLETMLALLAELLNLTEAGSRPVRLLGVSVSNLGDADATLPVQQLRLNL
jgi:DNA polymerase-4